MITIITTAVVAITAVTTIIVAVGVWVGTMAG